LFVILCTKIGKLRLVGLQGSSLVILLIESANLNHKQFKIWN